MWFFCPPGPSARAAAGGRGGGHLLPCSIVAAPRHQQRNLFNYSTASGRHPPPASKSARPCHGQTRGGPQGRAHQDHIRALQTNRVLVQ